MVLIAILLAAALSGLAQVNDFTPQSPAFAPVTDQPGLPRVLLIGDSISIGYTMTVRQELAGKANVHRIPENGSGEFQGDLHVCSSSRQVQDRPAPLIRCGQHDGTRR